MTEGRHCWRFALAGAGVLLFAPFIATGCRISHAPQTSDVLDAEICEGLQTFTLAPLPGRTAGERVTDDDGVRRGIFVSPERSYFFRFCPGEAGGGLYSITKLEDLSGIIALEHSASHRFTSAAGVGELFSSGQSQGFRLSMESRNLKFEGGRVGGEPVVFVSAINSGPFGLGPQVGALVPATLPRPDTARTEPIEERSFIICDAGTVAHSFSEKDVRRGADRIDIQIDVCLDTNDAVVKSAVLLVLRSEWNGQTQTDVIKMPGTEMARPEDLVFGGVEAGTRLRFASTEPLGRNVISSIGLIGRTDGKFDLQIGDAVASQIAPQFGPLTAIGECLPGEELVRPRIRFETENGIVNVNLIACQIFQFGATGTTSYRFTEIVITDSDARLSEGERVLKGDRLTEHSRLVVTHHNSCDKLELTFADVQYGFTSPETFSFGNECEEDRGVAPPNRTDDQLSIRKRVTVAGTTQTEVLTIPWGKGLSFSPKVTLSAASDPLD